MLKDNQHLTVVRNISHDHTLANEGQQTEEKLYQKGRVVSIFGVR